MSFDFSPIKGRDDLEGMNVTQLTLRILRSNPKFCGLCANFIKTLQEKQAISKESRFQRRSRGSHFSFVPRSGISENNSHHSRVFAVRSFL